MLVGVITPVQASCGREERLRIHGNNWHFVDFAAILPRMARPVGTMRDGSPTGHSLALRFVTSARISDCQSTVFSVPHLNLS